MAKRKRTRGRKTADASHDKPSNDSAASQPRKSGGDDSGSPPPKRDAKLGRRPQRRRNSDDDILEHRWEVVSDDSSGGRRRDRPGQDRGKRAGDEQGKKTQEPKRADQKAAGRETADEVSEGKRPAKRRKRVKKMHKAAEAAPKDAGKESVKKQEPEPVAESREPEQAKKKRPARKRRKKQTAKAEPEPAATEAVEPEAVVEQEKPAEPEVERPKRRRRKRRGAKAEPEPAATEAVESEAVVEQEKQVVEESGSFWDMALSSTTQDALRAAGYLEPTPVQAGLIPRAITGIDLMGQARTGTGKTAAFAIPILEQIETGVKKRGPQALILVPTRELAVQVRDECAKLAAGAKARVVAVYGGKPIRQQMEKLQRGAEVVVGTPGRVMDHMARGTLFLGDLRIAVLDEADRMLDIGFRPDIEKILRKCPQSRQTLLLSATLPPPVKRLAQQYMHEPEVLDFSPQDVAVETIEQFYFTVDAVKKFDLLVKLLERENPTQAIIFCRTRRGTEKIYQRLSKKEKGAACIHGDLPQSTRDRVMRDFRAGKVRLLMATDVVGRGIDVTAISHIINYDTPEFCDDYVHRVGRTGRMGREGVAYSFVTPEEGNELTRIEMRINRLLKRDEIAGISTGPKPEGVAGEEESEKPESKPVFGRLKKRVRRAL